MKPGMLVLSWGGADLFEITPIIARGDYPPGPKIFKDRQDWFILFFVQLK